MKLAPLEQSRPKIPIQELLEATKPIRPFPWDDDPDMRVGDVFSDILDNIFDMFSPLLK